MTNATLRDSSTRSLGKHFEPREGACPEVFGVTFSLRGKPSACGWMGLLVAGQLFENSTLYYKTSLTAMISPGIGGGTQLRDVCELFSATGESFRLRSFAPWFVRVRNNIWHGCASWQCEKTQSSWPFVFVLLFYFRTFFRFFDSIHLN